MDKRKSGKHKKLALGISIGDINGIGPEVLIKSLSNLNLLKHAILVVYGHGKVLLHYKKLLKIEGFSFHQYEPGSPLKPEESKRNQLLG